MLTYCFEPLSVNSLMFKVISMFLGTMYEYNLNKLHSKNCLPLHYGPVVALHNISSMGPSSAVCFSGAGVLFQGGGLEARLPVVLGAW